MTNMHSKKVHRMLVEGKALWKYPGEPRVDVPHALLASGLHSNVHLKLRALLKTNPDAFKTFAEMICDVLRELPAVPYHIDRVVGADMSSTPLAVEVAAILGAKPIRMQKQEDADGTKRQRWFQKPGEELQDREVLLHVEDVVTTGFSSNLVRAGIAEASHGAPYRFVQYIPVVVNRSNPRIEWLDDECRFVPLLGLNKIKNFKPETCPYCEAGSEAIPPKKGDNWERLTQVA